MNQSANQYYQSHQKLSFIGQRGQSMLSNSKVLVIGAGGLGCPCLQYLAGCGIKIIGVADFDTVAVSNLHRQTLFTIDDVGLLKTRVAVKKLQQQNPFITLMEDTGFVNEENILSLLKNYDVIVDATDNFGTRYLINDACVLLNKPLVYGAIHKSEGHVTVFNYLQSATLRCLFPESTNNNSIPGCTDIGAYNITTGIIGVMMANEVVKIVTQNENVLAGQLFCIEVIGGKTKKIHFTSLPDSRQKSIRRFENEDQSFEIDPALLWQKINNEEALQLIDVRDEAERRQKHIGGIHIPVSQFTDHFPLLLHHQMTVLYCQHGNRSSAAVAALREQGIKNIYSLQGGIHYFLQQYPHFIYPQNV